MLASSSIALKPAPDAALPGAASAWSVDEELLRLAHAEAGARVELGRAAERFLAIGGHHRLAFSRVGDYSRERLGISGRELLLPTRADLLVYPAAAGRFWSGLRRA